MSKQYFLKDNINFEELLKFEYTERGGDYFKECKREICIHKYNRQIKDYVYDKTTKCGYKFKGEYRHNTAYYIKDLMDAGLVEVRNGGNE